jgi:allantoinase
LAPPTGATLLPDVPNWSWHEYGMRVGAWRFFDLFANRGIKPTLATNARVCEDYPRVAEQALSAGWEFMGHAYDQIPIHKSDDQKAMIERSLSVIERFTGARPIGWLGPGLTQTYELLAEAGIKYIADWVYDDEPTCRSCRWQARWGAMCGSVWKIRCGSAKAGWRSRMPSR